MQYSKYKPMQQGGNTQLLQTLPRNDNFLSEMVGSEAVKPVTGKPQNGLSNNNHCKLHRKCQQ